MRKSFEEKMETVDVLQEKLSQFLDISPNLSFQESYDEMTKCNAFTDKIEKNIQEEIPQNTNSNRFGTDLAVVFMCRYLSVSYEKATLLTYTTKLKEELLKSSKSKKNVKSKKKKHVNKFTKS